MSFFFIVSRAKNIFFSPSHSGVFDRLNVTWRLNCSVFCLWWMWLLEFSYFCCFDSSGNRYLIPPVAKFSSHFVCQIKISWCQASSRDFCVQGFFYSSWNHFTVKNRSEGVIRSVYFELLSQTLFYHFLVYYKYSGYFKGITVEILAFHFM